MIDRDRAKIDPSSVFKRPSDILKASTLSKEEKIDFLQRWAYDEREMSVAEEENMLATTPSTKHNILDEIMKCLITLGVRSSRDGHPPTKQG